MAIVKKDAITFRVAPRFKQKLEKLAEYDKRTLADYIRIELEKVVENEEKEGKLKEFYKNER